MTSHTPDPATRPSIRRYVRHGIAAVVLTATVTAVLDTGTAGADALQVQPLPTNALALEVSINAVDAVRELEEFSASGKLVDYAAFAKARSATARLAARQLGYPELDMARAWGRSPLDHQRAVLAAMTQVGVPYRSNTSEPGVGFDCSGLTTFAWQQAGIELFRQSGSQIDEAAGLDRETAKAGDLAYYPGHVMMYLGVGNAVIHSVQTGRTVEIDTISERRANSVRFGDPSV